MLNWVGKGAIGMHVSLTAHLSDFVREKVDSGRYNNASEVMREALRLMEMQDELRRVKLERLREAVHIGDLQASRGQYGKRTIDQLISDNEARVRR